MIDEVLKYTRIIEMVENSNDKESLINTLRFIFNSGFEEFTNIQDNFNSLESKIQRLYEVDSQINLTNINNSKMIEEVLDEELSKEYGKDVLNFSDKNYILYAHILSDRENIDDMINGVSTGRNNFISLSPLSYLGQKYYYDYSEMILLYDEIPNGSFICSSKNNIGSNGHIKNNSCEVDNVNVRQMGILETSSVTRQNAEALLYREGLIPKAIALPGGRTPTRKELEVHNKYNLPFVITQEINSPIENVKRVFTQNNHYIDRIEQDKKMDNILELLSSKININTKAEKYTGREIAIFTDSHSLCEPTLAILEDTKKRGITEIYSLGDNIGVGPNPSEVFDMLDAYNVKSIMGNSEYYNTLGTAPFTYFHEEKEENQEWTKDKLGTRRIDDMKQWNPSIDLLLGNKKIGLCHFINDIRWDYINNSTWTYQDNFIEGINSKQFLYTNSLESKKELEKIISRSDDKEFVKGVLDAKRKPLFNGKTATSYDSILQGHVHFEMTDYLDKTDILTLRASAMGYKNGPNDMACYYILREKKDGTYDIEKILVPFNRDVMLSNIKSSTIPHKEPILKMTK